MDDSLREEIARAHAAVYDDARAAALAALTSTGATSARHRLALLCDGNSFVEYGALAGRTSAPDDTAAADGLICGIAEVHSMAVVVAATDRSVLDGRQSARNQRKLARLTQVAHHERWPLILLLDGDGARPDDPRPPPPIMVAPLGRYGLLDALATLNGWAPTLCYVSGRALDAEFGAALLCDFAVAQQSAVVGCGDDVGTAGLSVTQHAARGDLDAVVDDDAAGIALLRRYLELAFISRTSFAPSPEYARIAGIVPSNRRSPYDMRKLIAAFADDGDLLELAPSYGRSMVTALARLHGRPVGIFANQPKSPLAGSIDVDAADKATRFIERCDALGIPLVAFVDNPGFMVGPQSEANGMARHHARPLSALHHRRVPLCSVQVRKAYGLGPYAMSGWGSSRNAPLAKLAWPSVESGGMSLEGAAYLVKRKEIAAAATPAEALAIRNEYADRMRDATTGIRAGRSFQFDDIIDPTATRERIATLLARASNTRPTAPQRVDLR